MKNLQELKALRAGFNKELWDEYSKLKKSYRAKLDTIVQASGIEQAKKHKEFVRRGIKQAGTAELADHLLIKDSKFERLGIYLNTDKFHAQALLRSDMEISQEVLLELASLFLGEPIPATNNTDIDKLNRECRIIDDYKFVLKGKHSRVEYDENAEDDDAPYTEHPSKLSSDRKMYHEGSSRLDMASMYEAMDAHERQFGKPMSAKEARRIMNEAESKVTGAKYYDGGKEISQAEYNSKLYNTDIYGKPPVSDDINNPTHYGADTGNY